MMGLGKAFGLFGWVIAAFSFQIVHAEEMDLRVLTYNIQGLPLPWMDHTRYRDIGEILAERRTKGIAPHIVAIQEAFHERTDELVAAAGYPYVSYGPTAKGLKTGLGLVILSEFELLAPSSTIYTDCDGSDCYARKAMQHVKAHRVCGTHDLEVFNTHMDADDDQFYSSQGTRLRQIGEAQDFMKKKAGAFKGQIIALGDFNFLEHKTDYQLFNSFWGLKNTARLCLNVKDCLKTPKFDEYFASALDHQWVRQGEEEKFMILPAIVGTQFTKPYKGRMLSDHVGLEAMYVVICD